jgi:hypothetical protein
VAPGHGAGDGEPDDLVLAVDDTTDVLAHGVEDPGERARR